MPSIPQLIVKIFALLCLQMLVDFSAIAEVINGRVLSLDEQEPIAFASVALGSTGQGSVADFDGNYSILIPEGYTGDILFAHASYFPVSVSISVLRKETTVYLESRVTQLAELIFLAGENPADQIIRDVIKNKKRNDPARFNAYQYTSYNKEVYRLDGDVRKVDSLANELQAKDQLTLTDEEKALLNMQKNVKHHHLFVSESVAEVKYITPGVQNETILASNVTGMKGGLFSATGSYYHPFGFYADVLEVHDKNFINPINPSALSQYDFYLEDTTSYFGDTVYVISFEPKRNKKFEGLKGFLHVHAKDKALTQVTAASTDQLSKMLVEMGQKYDKIEGHWFPIQLDADITFKETQISGRSLIIEYRRSLSDIEIDPLLSVKDFSDVLVTIQRRKEEDQMQLLDMKRNVPLDSLETNTFLKLDSMSANFEFIEKLVEIYITQRIPVGKIDLKLEDFLGFNNYENVRYGLGMETNASFSKKLRLGGYTGYGVGDEEWKYGGNVRWEFNKRTSTSLLFEYNKDLRELGYVDFFEEGIRAFSDIIRNWQGSTYDRQELYNLSFNTRIAPFVYGQVLFSTSQSVPTYDYAYNIDGKTFNEYLVNELSMSMRYVRNEKYFEIFGRKILMGYDFPAFNIKYAHSNDGWLGSDFNYHRIDASFEYEKIYKLGTTKINLKGGYIIGDIPYSYLITGWGNGPSNWSVPNYFQTMGLYEYVSDKGVALYLNHNFGNVFYSSKISKPELLIYQNSGIGELSSAENHTSVTFATMEQGFFESGFGFKNLLRLNYLNMLYLGFGAEVFCRYGAYQLPEFTDNLAVKISMDITF